MVFASYGHTKHTNRRKEESRCSSGSSEKAQGGYDRARFGLLEHCKNTPAPNWDGFYRELAANRSSNPSTPPELRSSCRPPYKRWRRQSTSFGRSTPSVGGRSRSHQTRRREDLFEDLFDSLVEVSLQPAREATALKISGEKVFLCNCAANFGVPH